MAKSISIRFNDEEMKVLSKKIAESGMTQSEFIRTACMNLKIIVLDSEHKLYTELTQLISGINQMNKSGIKKKGLRKEAANICKLLQSLQTEVNQIVNS